MNKENLSKEEVSKLRGLLKQHDVEKYVPEDKKKHLEEDDDELCPNCNCPIHPCLPCGEVVMLNGNEVDYEYCRLLEDILEFGKRKKNRTGVDTIGIFGEQIKFDLSEGFPLLTTRKIPFKSVKVGLEGFIKGITDKRWYQERGCHYWDEWCNPSKVPYGHDEETKRRMKDEWDLGKIYGYQWRNFNSSGVDQLKNVVNTLKKNPTDRRMIVSAWNPCQLDQMALPPCHFWWMVGVEEDRLNLVWGQRSVDSVCGLPSNIASYALLLHLLAKETGLKEGMLTGQLVDTHIYVNHIDNIKIQLERTPKCLPNIKTEKFTSIFDWTYEDTELIGYDPHPKLEFKIAI